MANTKPFSTIIGELKERKKFERESAKKFNEATCTCCKKKLSDMGRSNLVGVCGQCINNSLNPSPEPNG